MNTTLSEAGVESALLPCPLCGKQPQVRDFIATGSANYVQIECWHFGGDPDADECASSVTVNADTMALAVEAWNRRAPAPDSEARYRQALIDIRNGFKADPMTWTSTVAFFIDTVLGSAGGDHIPGVGKMVPEGWKLVPVEPTEAMLEAGRKFAADPRPGEWPQFLAALYGKIIAASPSPPTAAGAGEAVGFVHRDVMDRLQSSDEHASEQATIFRAPPFPELRHRYCALYAVPHVREALSVEELQFMLHLREDQQTDVHSVVESNRRDWDLGFSLSDRGMLAMVNHPRGATFHITRLGLKAIDRALSEAKP